MMIEETLREIGLTQNEIKVYLALLELGETKTGALLRRSGLNSGKIYEILNALQKKGLTSSILKAGTQYFSPANPNRVLSYLEEKKQTLEQQEKDYRRILPELLQKIALIEPASKIEIFTGLKGLKTAYAKELAFGKKETLYVLGVLTGQAYAKQIRDFFLLSHQSKRERQGYRIKKLLAKAARGEQQYHEKNAEIRFVSHGSPVSINVISKLTTIGIFTDEPVCISIESETVAENFKNQFQLLWSLAKP